MSTERSDFAAAFRPFNVRKGVILSNTNRFTSAKYLQASAKTNAMEVNKDGVSVINLCSDDDGATSHRGAFTVSIRFFSQQHANDK